MQKSTIPVMPPDLKKQFTALESEVWRLHAKWKIFRQLFSHSDERSSLLSYTAPGFFRIVQDVLRDDVFITLSRLTDEPEMGGSMSRVV